MCASTNDGMASQPDVVSQRCWFRGRVLDCSARQELQRGFGWENCPGMHPGRGCSACEVQKLIFVLQGLGGMSPPHLESKCNESACR